MKPNVKKGTATVNDIPRSFAGLRTALFDELDLVRSGNGSAERVRAVVAIAGRVNDTVHAEMKARKALGEQAGSVEAVRSLLA